jgi:phosphoribosylanthranilate isomerase
VIVKVCGITCLEDAALALEHGANALGFNFWPSSSRFIEIDAARTILTQLRREYPRARCLSVGVVVGADDWDDTPTDVLQWHGVEAPSQIEAKGRRIWFAVSPETIDRFADHEVIIDSSWGRGRIADWNRIASIGRPYILSGGLTPENVASAIRRLHPAGVDVCSGVESRPGRKDPARLIEFLKEVERANTGE